MRGFHHSNERGSPSSHSSGIRLLLQSGPTTFILRSWRSGANPSKRSGQRP
jgi:hypothetical protein